MFKTLFLELREFGRRHNLFVLSEDWKESKVWQAGSPPGSGKALPGEVGASVSPAQEREPGQGEQVCATDPHAAEPRGAGERQTSV